MKFLLSSLTTVNYTRLERTQENYVKSTLLLLARNFLIAFSDDSSLEVIRVCATSGRGLLFVIYFIALLIRDNSGSIILTEFHLHLRRRDCR